MQAEHARLLREGWRLGADGCYRKPCGYEVAARASGWNLIPDQNGGCFERSASDEPERIWLCGNWKELCEFAAIEAQP